ncbi:MAG: GTPase Era [Alkalispirochaetaceae bacterium]
MWHMESQGYRSGFVAIVGRPSSGKSTFLNTVCGHKVSIVTPIPQTTRAGVRGIVSRDSGQIVFLDTPGFHRSEQKFNRRMMGVVRQSVEDGDAILLVIDGYRSGGEEEEAILNLALESGKPLLVAVNKEDLDPGRVKRRAEEVRGKVEGRNAEVLRLTAFEQESAQKVVSALVNLLPEGEPFYPAEYYTDQDPIFRITEIVREKAMGFAREELPHALYVALQDSEQGDLNPETGQPSSLFARIAIFVERESQKGILVGKGGRVVRAIREQAEEEIGELFDYPVRIELRVKVKPKWRRDEKLLEEFFG